MMKITKKGLDNEEYEVEEGVYIFFANNIRNLKDKLTDLVMKRTVPLVTSDKTRAFIKTLNDGKK